MSQEAMQELAESSDISPRQIDVEDNSHNVQECVKKLRELLQGEKTLKVRTDDGFMLRYLRWLKFDPELAFKRIKQIYKYRANNRDWYCSEPPSKYEAELGLNISAMLSERDNRGRRVYVVKTANIDSDLITPQTLSHLDDLWLESVIEEEETQKNGLAVILDLEGHSWKLFSWVTPHNIRVAIRKTLATTIRNMELHVVNSSFLHNASLALMKTFVNPKIHDYVYFHGDDWSSLHEHINPEILPEEYGGYGCDIDYEKLRKIIYDKSDQIMETFSLGLTIEDEEAEIENRETQSEKDQCSTNEETLFVSGLPNHSH